MSEEKTRLAAQSEKLKIAVVGPVYPYKGGISHYTGLLIRAFRAAGYETDAVSFRMQYPRILFRREQRDYANRSFAIEDTRYLIHTANPFGWRRQARAICEKSPDILLLQWWHPYFAPCYQALMRQIRRRARREGRSIRIACLCHNVLPHERFPLDAWLVRGTLRHADYCIVQSGQDAADLKEVLPQMRQVLHPHPTYNAFQMRGIGRAQARSELGIPEGEEALLFFGFVREYKGLDLLLRAMAGGQAQGRKLYVVGDFGSEEKKQRYLDIIESCGITEQVVLRDGYVPDAEVEPYFAAADVCVCPYRSATQSGIVQIAYGFGLPVIAAAVGGLPEVVSDGRTGLLVPPEDVTALSDAIERYFTEHMEERLRQGIEREAPRFSWEAMVEEILRCDAAARSDSAP